jgi:DNA-binding transcriptional MerR regulator
MANIHNISRQALIYYDHIGLFKPSYTDDKGYRYYSIYQIPFLREICFLKSIGIDLKDIRSHFENRDIHEVELLLEKHQESIDKQINYLNRIRLHIQQRLNIYSHVETENLELYQPRIQYLEERKVVFVRFPSASLTKHDLHLSLMKAWKLVTKHGMLPSNGFGTIILKNSISCPDIFNGAGAYILLPYLEEHIENLLILPAGEYVCMRKYGMPFDTKHLFDLISWIEGHRYSIAGNIVDACLLDTTFYQNDTNVDLCTLQIPVEKL